jgi:aquaporin Z
MFQGICSDHPVIRAPARFPAAAATAPAFVCDIGMTAIFPIVVLGATDGRAAASFAPIPIGPCLTLISLIGIPVTNTPVNSARSTGPALFVGGWALSQLWLFWATPIIGALMYGWVGKSDRD